MFGGQFGDHNTIGDGGLSDVFVQSPDHETRAPASIKGAFDDFKSTQKLYADAEFNMGDDGVDAVGLDTSNIAAPPPAPTHLRSR